MCEDLERLTGTEGKWAENNVHDYDNDDDDDPL